MTVEYTVRNGAFDAQSQYYTTYMLGNGTIHDHNYYESEDGTSLIYHDSCGSWAMDDRWAFQQDRDSR